MNVFRFLSINAVALGLLILFLSACSGTESPPDRVEAAKPLPIETQTIQMEQPRTLDPAIAMVRRTVASHGGMAYENAHYAFVFRDKTYTFQNDGNNYVYTVTYEKDGQKVVDRLDNGVISRTIEGKPTELSPKEAAVATEALNSVIYFATLPHKLSDAAVIAVVAGKEMVKERGYTMLKINFQQEGGGVDHEDNFMYWLNSTTGRVDYLAYDYKTNGGGVRFRSAYNPRVIDGILFQDYVNYKAPVGTPLSQLAKLYEAGELEELSRIETEDIRNLASN